MAKKKTRRGWLGVLGSVSIAGCLGGDDEPDSPDDPQNRTNSTDDGTADGTPGNEPIADGRSGEDRNTTDEVPEGCGLQDKKRRGQGPQIEVVSEVESSDEPRWTCAREAARAAFDRVTEETEFDPSLDAGTPWMFPSPSDRGDTYGVAILVREIVDAQGDHRLCPPPEYEFDSVVEHVPEKVTVELHVADRDESVTCSHDVYLEQTTFFLD